MNYGIEVENLTKIYPNFKLIRLLFRYRRGASWDLSVRTARERLRQSCDVKYDSDR